MRLIAIRGRNLASLAEAFEIDLTQEPLRSAGLFAITGETGAGKSTLLDALCLALYGTTPRIRAQGGAEDVPDASGEPLKANDPANLLRRGASEGFAEVDFASRDGTLYRAGWTVRRARNKAGGRLRPVERTLFRISPTGDLKPLADGKETVNAEIATLTDLTFEQFRRTALLAQGEFDAFLRANDTEKADLLEKITGSDVYGQISIEVFRLSREAEQVVAQLEARLGGVILLSGEEHDKLVEQRTEASQRLTEAQNALAALTAERGRRLTMDATLKEFESAQGALAVAQQAIEDAAPQRAEKRRLDAIAPLRPLQRALLDARHGAQAAASLEQIARDAIATAEAARSMAQEASAARGAAAEAAAAALEALEPQWRLAADLDTQIETARHEATNAALGEANARRQEEAAQTRVTDLQAESVRLEQVAETLEHDRQELAALLPFVQTWPALQPRFRDRAQARTDTLAADRIRQEAELTLERLRVSLTNLAEKILQDEAAQALLRGQLEARDAALDAVDEAALRADVERFRTHAELRREALRAALAYRDAEARRQTALTERDRAAQEQAAAAARQAKIEAEREENLRKRRDQQGGVDLASAIEDQASARLRSALVAHEPCPVCGSSDHPALQHGDALMALATQLKSDRAALDRAIEVQDNELSALARTLAGGRERERAASEAIDRGNRVCDVEAAAFTKAATALGLRALIADAEATLVADTARFEADRLAADDRLKARDALRAERDTLRARFERLSQSLYDGRRTQAPLLIEQAEAVAARDSAVRLIEQGRQRLSAIDAEVSPILDASRLTLADLDRDGRGTLERLHARLQRLEIVERDRAALDQKRQTLAPDLAVAKQALEQAEGASREAQTGRIQRDGALADLVNRRATLLGGESTIAHRQRHLDAEQSARALARAAEAEAMAADLALATAKARHAETLAQRGRAESHVAQQAEAFATALALAGVTPEEAEALLVVSPSVIDALDADLKALDERLSEAQALRNDADRRLAALTAEAPPVRPLALIEPDMTQAEAMRGSIERQIGEIETRLQADAEAQDRAAGILAEIKAARDEAAIIAAVNDAIGSENGAKFRRIAQSLTLERLLALANQHLAALSPRYRLSRAEIGTLGLHIIDRDMGDAIRSTRSLSGGERFLASLALALALSSLEGRRSFVDTLFIDEGFGALDAATLDVAIDALEALHSQGRRVGVISHVAAMIERIAVQVRVEKAGQGRSVVRVGLASGA